MLTADPQMRVAWRCWDTLAAMLDRIRTVSGEKQPVVALDRENRAGVCCEATIFGTIVCCEATITESTSFSPGAGGFKFGLGRTNTEQYAAFRACNLPL